MVLLWVFLSCPCERKAKQSITIFILPYLIKFLPFFVWFLPNGDSLPKKHSFLTQKTMFFCRKNYVFSLLKRPLAETKSRTAESFPFLAKLFPLLVVFFFLGQPSLSVLTRHKARQSTKQPIKRYGLLHYVRKDNKLRFAIKDFLRLSVNKITRKARWAC